jgi:hypothetical protein
VESFKLEKNGNRNKAETLSTAYLSKSAPNPLRLFFACGEESGGREIASSGAAIAIREKIQRPLYRMRETGKGKNRPLSGKCASSSPPGVRKGD